MDPYTVRVNNFVHIEARLFIDKLSKFFLIKEYFLGVNRLFVLGKNKQIFEVFLFIFAVISNCTVLYFGTNKILIVTEVVSVYLISIKVIQYEFIAVFSFISWRRFKVFFKELDNFDNMAKCRPNVSNLGATNIYLCGFVLMCYIPLLLYIRRIAALPLHLISCLEIYLYAHLLNLLVARIRLINYCMENRLQTIKPEIKSSEFKFFKENSDNNITPDLDELMDYFKTITNAHNLLVDAIKWQVSYIKIAVRFALSTK